MGQIGRCETLQLPVLQHVRSSRLFCSRRTVEQRIFDHHADGDVHERRVPIRHLIDVAAHAELLLIGIRKPDHDRGDDVLRAEKHMDHCEHKVCLRLLRCTGHPHIYRPCPCPPPRTYLIECDERDTLLDECEVLCSLGLAPLPGPWLRLDLELFEEGVSGVVDGRHEEVGRHEDGGVHRHRADKNEPPFIADQRSNHTPHRHAEVVRLDEEEEEEEHTEGGVARRTLTPGVFVSGSTCLHRCDGTAGGAGGGRDHGCVTPTVAWCSSVDARDGGTGATWSNERGVAWRMPLVEGLTCPPWCDGAGAARRAADGGGQLEWTRRESDRSEMVGRQSERSVMDAHRRRTNEAAVGG